MAALHGHACICFSFRIRVHIDLNGGICLTSMQGFIVKCTQADRPNRPVLRYIAFDTVCLLSLSPSLSLSLPLSLSLSHSLFKNPKTTQQQRHLHGARHFPHRHLGARHAAPGRLQDHRRRQQREGRPGSPQRRPEAPRSAHHDRRGRRLRRQRHVRRRARPRSRQRVPDRVPALLRGHHRHLPRRAAAEGLRPRLGHLAVHRDQHLREHHLEGLQPLHRHRRARVRVRGGRDRAVPSAADAR